MYGQPWYSGYPTYPANGGYSPFASAPVPRSAASMRALQEERARALAERRARRARYLPDEDDDDMEDDYDFWPSQVTPQRSDLAAKARQEELERVQREEELRRQEQARRRQEEEILERKRLQEEATRRQTEDEQRRQAALEQQQRRREELARKYREEQEARQRMVEEQKRLRREEEARRLAAAEEEKRRQAEMSRPRESSSASRDDNSIPIHIHRTSNAQQKPSRSPTPTPASPKSVHSLEEKNEAASRIQKQYRIHRTFRQLEELRTQFEALKKGFTYPHVIDFEKHGSDGGVVGVGAYRAPSDFDKDDFEPMQLDGAPEGKLAYTSTNYALNLYSDQLDKLLMKLDGVESYGEKGIREQRRAAVKAIEKEASKLDRYCKQTWLDYVEKQRKTPATSQPPQPSDKSVPKDQPPSDQPSSETPTTNEPTTHPNQQTPQDSFRKMLTKKERRKQRRRQRHN